MPKVRAHVRVAVAVAVVVASSLVGGAGPVPVPAPAGAQVAPTYANPLSSGLTENPSVLRAADGTYYAYVEGFDYFGAYKVYAFSSPDLATWTAVGDVLGSAGAWADTSSGFKFTTPSVRLMPANPAASRYVLYYTGTKPGLTTKCIGVATAAAPQGPFTGAAQPLICPEQGAKDASPVPGSDQVVYKANLPSTGIYALTLTPSGTAVAAGATPTLLLRTAEGFRHDGILERPAVAKDPAGRPYLFARTGAQEDGVSWTRCTTSGPDLTSCSRRWEFGSWLGDSPTVGASGGIQVFTDEAGAQWISYHGYPASACTSFPCTGTATMRIDKLCFDHGHPRTNGPSTGAQTTSRPADCSADIPGASLSPDPAVDNVLLDQAADVRYRDGGVGVPMGGRLLWLFSDTIRNSNCPAGGGVTNSANLGMPHPSAANFGYGSPFQSGGCTSQFIPYTANEAYYNYVNASSGKRIALWENGGIPLMSHTSLVFFVKLVHDSDIDGAGPDGGCGFCYTYIGQGVVRVSPGDTEADRASTAVACASTCLFTPSDGDWFGRPILDDQSVYMYSDTPDLGLGVFEQRIGRVPIATVLDRSTWEFRTGSGSWSPDVADATDVPGVSTLPPNVSYNPYLDRFVNIHPVSVWPADTDVVGIQTAPDPWGPWSATTNVYDYTAKECPPTSGVAADAYGGTEATWTDSAGGRELRFTYARPPGPSCAGQMRLVTFRID